MLKRGKKEEDEGRVYDGGGCAGSAQATFGCQRTQSEREACLVVLAENEKVVAGMVLWILQTCRQYKVSHDIAHDAVWIVKNYAGEMEHSSVIRQVCPRHSERMSNMLSGDIHSTI